MAHIKVKLKLTSNLNELEKLADLAIRQKNDLKKTIDKMNQFELKVGTKTICNNCNTENDEDANFCEKCGKKLVTVCNCWVKEKPYNCGQKKCPSYELFLKKYRKED